MFDVTQCQIIREADANYLISWQGPQAGKRVAIYISDNPHYFYYQQDLGKPLLETTQHQIIINNPNPSARHYFYLHSEDDESIILAERQIPLEGTPNFRDIGGYKTLDGRHVKWGHIYRSSKLSALSDSDISYIETLGNMLVCDFRKPLEREIEPSQLGNNHPHQIEDLPVTPGSSSSFMDNLHNGIIAVDDSQSFMQSINRDFVINQMNQYAKMFDLLLAHDSQLLIHCASGKDRTGFAAALILDVLGVSEESIIYDYLLTNQYIPIEKEIDRISSAFTDESGDAIADSVLRPLVEIKASYIQACFDEINQRFPSKQAFYAEALNLDGSKLLQLRERYLH